MNKIVVVGLIGVGVIAGVAITMSILKSKKPYTSERASEVKKDTAPVKNIPRTNFEEVAVEKNNVANDISARHKEATEIILESVREFTDENDAEIKGEHEDELDKMIDDINSIWMPLKE